MAYRPAWFRLMPQILDTGSVAGDRTARDEQASRALRRMSSAVPAGGSDCVGGLAMAFGVCASPRASVGDVDPDRASRLVCFTCPCVPCRARATARQQSAADKREALLWSTIRSTRALEIGFVREAVSEEGRSRARRQCRPEPYGLLGISNCGVVFQGGSHPQGVHSP